MTYVPGVDPPFDRETSMSLWKTFIRWTEERIRAQNRSNLLIKEEEIMQFAEKLYEDQDIRWNGRQIRNSFRTALAMAEHDVRDEKALRGTDDVQVVLGAIHFRRVAETSAKFDKFLMAIR